MAITEEFLDQARVKYGRVKHVVYNGVDIVMRKPKRVECQEHAARSDDPQQKFTADEQLCQTLMVACGEATDVAGARAAFTALLEDYPYAVKSKEIGTALLKLIGILQDDEGKSYGTPSQPNGTPSQTTPQG